MAAPLSRSDPPTTREPRAGLLAIFVLGLTLGWLVLIAYTIHPQLPPNLIRLPFEDKSRVSALLQQGWTFFATDPRVPTLSAYLLSPAGEWQSAMPTAWYNDSHGPFSRRPRALQMELARLIAQPAEVGWHDCDASPITCLDHIAPTEQLQNKAPSPSLCGEVGIVREALPPGRWEQSTRSTIPHISVSRLHVACSY